MAYPITDIRGIGPEAAAILKSEGIRTTVGLLRSAKTPQQRLKLAETVGIAKERVLDWVTAADRMRVKGVGSEYCELLRAAGVKTVKDLKFRNSQKLVERLQQVNKSKMVRLLPKRRTVERWIESAKKLPPIIRY
jgi:predicted flap endonuclease-1-like 5' DNA nuclease